MMASLIKRFGRRIALGIAMVGGTLVVEPLSAHQDSVRAPATSPARVQSDTQKVTTGAPSTDAMSRLQDDVDRLKIELDLRQQLWRAQEMAVRPSWAPWAALSIVAVAAALFLFHDRKSERDFDFKNKEKDREKDVPRMNDAIKELKAKVEILEKRVGPGALLEKNIDKLAAIVNALRGK
jgi:hypothetical protein